MRFNPKARLDTGQVSDGAAAGWRQGGGGDADPDPRRHQGRRRHRRHPRDHPVPGAEPCSAAADRRRWRHRLDPLGARTPVGDSGRYDECTTGADANESADCARVADVNSIQAYWERDAPRQTGTAYAPAETTPSPGRIDTGCGGARSDVGPFYCPRDDTRLPRHRRSSRTCSRGSSAARTAGSSRPTCSPTSTATTSRTCSAPWARSHPAGREQRRRAPRAAGRLLRRHVGQVRHHDRGRRRRGAHPRAHRGGHRPGPRRRRRRRRRPDPEQHLRPGRPRVLDPRLRRAAAAWFTHRLPVGHATRPATRSRPAPSRRAGGDRCRDLLGHQVRC